MQLAESDLIRFEEIALLLSATASLPHFKYSNRHFHYNYIVPIANPNVIIATRVQSGVMTDIEEQHIPVCGEIWDIGGVQTPVCSYIAYTQWDGALRISTHCEKVLHPCIDSIREISTQRTLDCKEGSLLKGLPLSATMNVINLSDYKW